MKKAKFSVLGGMIGGVSLALTVSAWANGPASPSDLKPENTGEPLKLTEEQMDEVSAGVRRTRWPLPGRQVMVCQRSCWVVQTSN